MAALAIGLTLAMTTGCGLFLANEHPRASARVNARPAAGCPEAMHAPFPPCCGSDSLEALEKVAPVYPDIAREANVSGTVVMKVLVCEHGHVMDAQIVRSVAMLDTAAIDAVRRWRFRRAMRDGQPVATWTTVPMKFTLN